MKQKGFARIDKIIVQNSGNKNLQVAFYKHQALKYWHDVIDGFISEAKDLTQAIDFKKGVLTVACLSREIANKIRVLSEQIIAALNEVLGKRLVFAIYTEV